MSKRKILLAGVAAMTAAVCLGTVYADGGRTEVKLSVLEAGTIDNVKIEVPLYLTVAVTVDASGQARMIVPDENYEITSQTLDVDIGVTGLKVSRVNGSEWKLVEEVTSEDGKEFSLNVGGIQLPDLSTALESKYDVDLEAQDSVFYQDGRYVPLSEHGTKVELIGSVPSGYQIAEGQPSPVEPQIALTYTVSPLGDDGQPLTGNSK